MIARVVIGLPEQAHAQVAEAYGCRVGLQMLAVAGGNLIVVRYYASEGRIRRPHIQELLEGPLGDIAIKRGQ